jgi:MoaA/NifB/PqqE/SkfB family radical SAM enzyme
MTETNPYYCPLIFQGLYVEKVNNNQVKTAACCLNRPGPAVDEIDFEHDPYLQYQRQQVLQQQLPPGCEICYQAELNGIISARQNAIQNFPEHSYVVQIRKLDYNVDPICNAKCIQCTSYYSSAWAAEDQVHGKKHIPRFFNQTIRNNLTESIDITTVHDLYFNGGEPMLSQEPLTILKKIDQAGNLKNLVLSLNTNGSIRPSDELVDLWKKCRGLRINFSIDAIGDAFEYIRNPLDWTTVYENICWVANLDIPHLVINIAYTMGMHNIDLVQETQDWFQTQSKNWKNTANFYVKPCGGPLSLEHVSINLKQAWLDRYPELTNLPQSQWQKVACQELKKVNEHCTDQLWKDHLEMIDQRRNLNWQTSLPGLYSAYKKSLG